MTRKQNVSARLILILMGIVPVGWLGLHLAPHLGSGLSGIIAGFQTAVNTPFAITIVPATPKCVLACLGGYALSVGIVLSSKGIPGTERNMVPPNGETPNCCAKNTQSVSMQPI